LEDFKRNTPEKMGEFVIRGFLKSPKLGC